MGCGDYEYENWGLITPLSEKEVKARMKEYAEQHIGKYHHGEFLLSLSDEGITCHDTNGDYLPEFGGDLLGEEIDLTSIKEADIYSKETYSKIVKQREEEERRKLEEQRRKREEAQKKRDLAAYEKLKKKLGKE